MRLVTQQLSAFELASLVELTSSHHTVQPEFTVPRRLNDEHGTYGTCELDLIFYSIKN